MDLEIEDQKRNKGKDIFVLGLIQVFVLFLGMLLYQEITKLQIETALSFKTPKQSFYKTKEVSETVPQTIAWKEPASVERALRDYTEFVITKRPWFLSVDRIIWGLCFLVPAYLFIRKIANVEVADFSDSLGGRGFLAGIVTGFATFCFVNVFSGLIFFFIGKPQSNHLELILSQNLQGNWRLLTWAMLAISFGAGILEETFFRGFLLKHFIEKDMPNIGLFITSVIFGVVHYSAGGSLVGPFLLIFVGLSFGLSYLKTANIWVPITAHITYNSSMLLAAFFLGNRVS
ncbi:CPBP family intramembrane metalloprotease [Leptospira semungkisensis]|uniref:CPBP family intramembrane metalloprotease n=1 Tax=Leptospira semungkisensis TaxID=2484985 RepID=A0A4R9G6N2_9LEPT|nr:CPBP family intramembrane glutamic endopeptidase [Leptospira semungkisensis]TGK07268.1 CPBP family intramembrane metalloprotease [Leptospira semungkisensis]